MRLSLLISWRFLDRQVPAKLDLDLDAIRTALANNPHTVIKELPKLKHLFQTAMTGAVDEYARIEERWPHLRWM